jgi:diaminopropionate ammonia-lyase
MLTGVFSNRSVNHRLPTAQVSRDPQTFHRRLPGYAPTPLLTAPDLAAALGVGQLWLKYEASRMAMPAYKILGASWAVYRALCERLPAPLPPWQTIDELAAHLEPLRPLTLAAATDGNHGRAVARMAALLRLGAHIFVPAGTADARINAIESEGARVTVVDGSYEEAVRRSAEPSGPEWLVISDTSWPGYETVPRWIIEGYSTIFWEIEDQLAEQAAPPPDVVLVQTGVGALAAAVVHHMRRADLPHPPQIVNVEPTRAACVLASMQAGELVEVPGPHDSLMAGLNCGRPSLVAWPLLAQGIDLFLAIDDEAARQAMRDLAQQGIVAGETGAAGVAGLTTLLTDPQAASYRQQLGIGPQTRVLAIITEGITDPLAYEQIVGTPQASG